jgi:hypothetical protein
MALKRQIYISRPWDRDFEDGLKLKTSAVPSPTYYNEKDASYFCNDALPTSGMLLTDRNVLENKNLTQTKNQVQDVLEYIKSRFIISCVVSAIAPIRKMMATVLFWQMLKGSVSLLNHWILKHFFWFHFNTTFSIPSCYLSRPIYYFNNCVFSKKHIRLLFVDFFEIFILFYADFFHFIGTLFFF